MGNPVSLDSLRGRHVLLVFYPADNTPGCTKQLCQLRDHWDLLQSENIHVFGVNPQSAASHAGFRRKQRLPFPLLVDKGRNVTRLYNAGGLLIRRTVYLIGPDGTIRFAQRGMPSPQTILAGLA
jgi:peroxiredoxin Q/BCP